MTWSVLETTATTPADVPTKLVAQLNAWAELPQPGGGTAPFTVETLLTPKHSDPTKVWVVLDSLLTNAVTLAHRADAAAAVGTAVAPGPLVTENNLKMTEVVDLVASGYAAPPIPH